MVNVSQNKMVSRSSGFKEFGAGSSLIVVDVQERLAPAIARGREVIPRIAGLIEKARDACLPILATEQYSRGLGPTVAPLRGLLAGGEIVEKIHFAAAREEGFVAALTARGVSHCLVVGMEAHVCVLQTALALLDRGVGVTLVTDAVASRDDLNRRLAVARLARAGADLAETAVLLAALQRPPALSP